MKTYVLLLLSILLATSCNSQVKKDTKNKGIIFNNWILDIDNLEILLENSTTKLDIVWNIDNEDAENNVIKPHTNKIIKDNDEKEFLIMFTDLIAKEYNQSFTVLLRDAKTKEEIWTYSNYFAINFGHIIQLIVADNKIVIATHNQISSGSNLICLDIHTGKEVWRGAVNQLNVEHSKYSNSLYIDLFDEKIVIMGNESYGRYIQVIDLNTGKNLFFKMENDFLKTEPVSILISKEKALKIANDDAQRAYRDFSIYTIKAELINEEWHIDYNLSDPQMQGGGPHYQICAKTGQIISYRYEQ